MKMLYGALLGAGVHVCPWAGAGRHNSYDRHGEQRRHDPDAEADG